MNTVTEVQKDNATEGTVKRYTDKELAIAIGDDKSLREEYLAIKTPEDEKVFFDKYLIPKEEGVKKNTVKKVEETPEPDPKPEAVIPTTEDDTLTIKVRKEMLGTYLKNRNPEDAILQALKGKQEADRHIDYLKKEKIAGLEKEVERIAIENNRLKKQLEVTKEAVTPKVDAKTEIKADFPDIEIPDIISGEDVPDREFGDKMVKIVNAVKALKEQNAGLRKELTDMDNRYNTKITEVEYKADVANKHSEIVDGGNSEYSSIDRFRKRYNDIVGYSRPIAEIEADYVQFMDDLAKVAGVKKVYKDGTSLYSDEMNAAYTAYVNNNTDYGKAINVACEERQIALPADKDQLFLIYDIKEIKDLYKKGDKPLDYDEAFKLYKMEKGGSLDNIIENQKAEKVKKMAKAEENLNQAAIETPANGGADMIDIAKIPREQITAIAGKTPNERSESDKKLFGNYLKHMGFSEVEIARLNGG